MLRRTTLALTLPLAVGCASHQAQLEGTTPAPGVCAADRCPLPADASSPPSAAISDATVDALLEALADERRARAFYLAVLERHGPVMPFTNIAGAEARHAQHVADLLTAYGHQVPPDTATFPPEQVPDTVAKCCSAAAQAEIDNIALYDKLIPIIEDDAVRQVFTQLRWASRERHLPAFQRRASRG